MFDRTIAIVLAGGVGSRLHPLTADRAKPAVPFGGKYRIIDFTLSNCLHSGLRRVLVLTQYKFHSLQKHLRDGWSVFNPSIGEFITTVPPQMRKGDSWYAGTADAVYQNLYLLERSGADQVMILSGDHIYRMDYAAMLRYHCDTLADATVACMTVPVEESSSFGVLTVDETSRVVGFQEKPDAPTPLPDDPDKALVSMGIYIFSCDLLCELLQRDHALDASTHDFGRDIFPRIINDYSVYGYPFGGSPGRVSKDRYWRDVGTIDAYYDANMDLLRTAPPIDLYQHSWPVRTTVHQSPPARTVEVSSDIGARVENSILCDGVVISGGSVHNSILSNDVRVEQDSSVEDSLLFEGVQVGEGTRLRGCIVDKFVDIPAGESIGFDPSLDAERFTVSDAGIVVVPKQYRFGFATATEASRRIAQPVR